MSGEGDGFCFKEHRADGKVILAVCDAEMSGKTLKFGDVDFHVSCSFYGDEGADKDEILKKVEEAEIVNVVGKKIVDMLVEKGLVNKDNILWMEDIPHVQIVKM